MRRLRILSLAVVVLAGLFAGACGDGLPSPSAFAGSSGPSSSAGCDSCGMVVNGVAPTVTVDATDALVFSPKAVSIKVGDVVEWKNTGISTHSVTFNTDSAITKAILSGGQTWEVKFTKAGSFPYVCTFHQALGMVGTVTVAAG